MESHTTQSSGNTTLDQIVNKESNSELIEIKDVEGTPYKKVKVDEKWYVGLAGQRVSKALASEEECDDVLNAMNVEINLPVIDAMIKAYISHNEILERLNMLEKVVKHEAEQRLSK